MDCPMEFSRQSLRFLLAYSEDDRTTIFRYLPYSRKIDKQRLRLMILRFGYTMREEQDFPEIRANRVQYSTIYRTNVPWEWYRIPSYYADCI
jgi:hypothetical protein